MAYDFEKLLSWGKPFTTPITPPDITPFSSQALSVNAGTIAPDVINRIEATCPPGTPGLDSHLEMHYLDIEQSQKRLARRVICLMPTAHVVSLRFSYLYLASNERPKHMKPPCSFLLDTTHIGPKNKRHTTHQDNYIN